MYERRLSKGRHGRPRRWRRVSIGAGLALALLAAAAAGLFSSRSTATTPAARGVISLELTAERSVAAVNDSHAHVHVWGGWRAPRVTVGQVTRLSAGNPPQAAPGVRLTYRWRTVSQPKGSHVLLAGASSAHPTLSADRPGRYVLQVTAGKPSTSTTADARPLCAAGCSSHLMTLNVAVSGGPLGVPVDTIAHENGQWGVQVGDQSTAGAAFYAAPVQSDALQLLVLDRSTLALVDNDSFANDPNGAFGLLATIQTLPASDLVIITRPGSEDNYSGSSKQPGLPDDTVPWVQNALSEIGAPSVSELAITGKVPSAVEPASGTCSEFSAIGVRYLPAGQGHTSDCQLDPSGSGTALQGYFRQDLSGQENYTFVEDTRVPFDTGDPTADPAVVTVGSDESGSPLQKTTYTSEDLNGGAGFFVVLLDSGSLKLVDKATFADNANGLQNMAGWLLGSDTNPHVLTIVRSIGKVGAPPASESGAVESWDQVAAELQKMGASQFYFEALNGGSDSQYAQIGLAGAPPYPSQTTQVATEENASSGRLTGLLAYDDANEFYPSESYVPSTLNDVNRPLAGTLPGIISLPPSAWPDRGTQADQNVLACVAANLGLKMPIESNYHNLNLVNNWSGWAAEIGEPSFSTKMSNDSACGPFTQADESTVIDQLQTEFHDVATVDTFIANLQKPLVDSQGNATQIQSITEQVDDDLATGSAQATVDGAAIASDMLWLVSSVPGVDAIAGPLNIAAAAVGLSDDLNNNNAGINLPDDQVATTGAELGNRLEAQYTTSIAGLGNIGGILVSDWTKLQDAAANAAGSPGAAADWSFGEKQLSETASALSLATRRTAYETLFPVAYSLYRLQNGDDSVQTASQYTCAQLYTVRGFGHVNTWQPFAGVQPFGSLQVRSTGASAEQWTFAAPTPDVTLGSNRSAQMPGASLLSSMFGPPQSGDTIQTGPLFSPLQFAVQTYHDGSRHTTTITHYGESAGNASSKDLCKVLSAN